MRPYTTTDGPDLLRQIMERLRRLERGTAKTRVPVHLTTPEVEVSEGAQLYVLGGELRVRMGTVDYVVNLTPVVVPPPE